MKKDDKKQPESASEPLSDEDFASFVKSTAPSEVGYQAPTFDELACELLDIVDDLRSDKEAKAEGKANKGGPLTKSGGPTLGEVVWNWSDDPDGFEGHYPGGLAHHDNERLRACVVDWLGTDCDDWLTMKAEARLGRMIQAVEAKRAAKGAEVVEETKKLSEKTEERRKVRLFKLVEHITDRVDAIEDLLDGKRTPPDGDCKEEIFAQQDDND